jgi:regulator of cell morphogenesis and NO signaling
MNAHRHDPGSTESSAVLAPLGLSSSVGSWVAAHPRTSRVFEALQLDYCCGGGKSLEEACRHKNLAPESVIQQLEHVIAESESESSPSSWLTASLTDLCDHIEHTHHTYLKAELPRLHEMITKVFHKHGGQHPELADVYRAFMDLESELVPHMFKEENILFPAIRRLEQAGGSQAFPFGSVANPIRMMEHEHDHAGNALARIRQATHDFAVPNDACNTYRVMLDSLATLESDLHQHIHKENNILFPRAIQLE